MENENGLDETLNHQEEVEETSEEVVEELDWKAEAEKLKAEAEKAKEVANNYKIRAEKAEREGKFRKEEPTKESDLSTSDLYALMESKVAKEDVQEVKDYAKLKGLSIAEALETGFIKSYLSDKAEQRNVALASNVGSVKSGKGRLSDEALVENVKKGIMPETDEDMMRYVKARKK